MHRYAKMAVIMKLIYGSFVIFKSLEESVSRENGKKGATVWIRAFIKLFSNALLHSQWPFGVCVSERVIYLTGQGHLHKASVRSTVHLQIEKKRRANVNLRNKNPMIKTVAKQ